MDGSGEDADVGPTSVTRRILSAFVDALALEEDLASVADRLRAAMIDDGDLTERGLRQALFGSNPP